MYRQSLGTEPQLLDAIVSVDEGRRIRFFNAAAERLFGLSAADAVGQPLGRLIPERLRGAFEEHVRDFAQSTDVARRIGAPFGEIGALHVNGREFPIEGSIFRATATDGPMYTLMLHDITERKRAEEALRQSQAQLRLLVEQAPISIAMLDRRLNYIATSHRWVAEYGRGCSDLIGRNHYEVHPDLSDAWKQVHRDALAGAILKNDEDVWIQADGSRHWLRCAVHPWTDESGAIGGIMISADDITERKKAEERLVRSQADLNRAQAVGHIGSWRLNVQRNELAWSAENHRIFGIPEGTPLTYETFLSRVHPDDREYVDRMWQAGLRGDPYDIEHRLIVDGEVKWVRERAELEFDEEGALRGGFGTTQDITQRKHSEQALLTAKEEAERANNAKTRFLSAVSHDLRQPLQTLSLLNSVLARKVGATELLDVVERQGATLSSMKHLLDVFLDLDRIATGVIKPKVDVFPMENLLSEVRQEFELEAAVRNLGLRVAPCSAMVRSDAGLLRRILQNLVSNAVKHTEQGRVLVGCRRRGERLGIEVWDTGPGIPEAALAAIFKDFVQLNGPARQGTKGVGLGLSVAKSLAQLLGHPLDVRSTPGKGSVFTIDVPLGGKTEARATELAKGTMIEFTGPPGARVLVVEDDPTVLSATCLLLRDLGLRVMAAANGAEGLARLRDSGGELHLIIADYRLPEGSGIDVIRRARRILGRSTPAVLVAGDTSPESMRDMEDSGCRVLHKPVLSNELVAQMNRLLGA